MRACEILPDIDSYIIYGDSNREITHISSLGEATPGALTFCTVKNSIPCGLQDAIIIVDCRSIEEQADVLCEHKNTK